MKRKMGKETELKNYFEEERKEISRIGGVGGGKNNWYNYLPSFSLISPISPTHTPTPPPPLLSFHISKPKKTAHKLKRFGQGEKQMRMRM